MRVADFDYGLPPELIAQYPAPERSGSRLLVLDPDAGSWQDRLFVDLPDLLHRGDLLVFNDTRVIKARLLARKESGGRVEIMVERLLGERRVLAQLRASKTPQAGQRLRLDDGTELRLVERRETLWELESSGGTPMPEVLDSLGLTPLPPYVRRRPEPGDAARYQTVYARRDGAVAAPTAGLHFDHEMLGRLERAGVQKAFVTLHVGAGTFTPVRAQTVEAHRMHREYAELSPETASAVRGAKESGERVVAVGTTSLRALESACRDGDIRAFAGETELFVYPGYSFRCVDALLTNFHLPRSTLLMLVCALAGTELVLAAYRHAVEARYRFFSYGDAMLITGRGARPDVSSLVP